MLWRSCMFLVVLLLPAAAPTAAPIDSAEALPKVDGVQLYPADPRSEALAGADPESAQHLYAGRTATGAVVHLARVDSGWLGVLAGPGAASWVTVQAGHLVPAEVATLGSQHLVDDWDEELGTEPLGSQAGASSTRDGRLQLFIDSDQAYVARWGDQANEHRLAVIHLVDAIFQAQLGFAIEVVREHAWNQAIPGTRSDSCGGVIYPWRSHWERVAPVTGSEHEAAHLFSGVPVPGTAGCAFTRQLETSLAYGVHETPPASQPDLLAREVVIAAHELGHNFNGRHGRAAPTPDGAVSQPCSWMTTGTIMYPCGGSAVLPAFSDAHGQTLPGEHIMQDGGNVPHMKAYAASRI